MNLHLRAIAAYRETQTCWQQRQLEILRERLASILKVTEPIESNPVMIEGLRFTVYDMDPDAHLNVDCLCDSCGKSILLGRIDTLAELGQVLVKYYESGKTRCSHCAPGKFRFIPKEDTSGKLG